MSRKRKKISPEEKAVILREHLISKVPVSDLCDQHGIHPTLFYRWQRNLFENLPSLFESTRASEVERLRKENEALKARLSDKDSVIGQIMEDYVAVKKSLGDL